MAGIPMAELVMQAHGCQDAWLQHLVKYKEQQLLERYVAHCKRKLQQHIARKHGGMAGLGFTPTRSSGIPSQFQRVESTPAWAKGMPSQSIAEGFRFAFPKTSSAFLDRSARIQGGHGGVFTGQVQRGAPQRAAQYLPSYRGPGPQVQQAAWTNPWTAQQWFTGPQGIPIWGGGYTQPFRSPGGASPYVQPVGNAAGQFPTVGTAAERF